MFLQPIQIGELVTFLASVNYTGRTSMEIGIKVVTENIRDKLVRHSNSCFFTMVAVDDNGKAVAVPQLVPSTDDQIRRFANGKERRAIRAELEERYKALHKK
jgi:acyl-CoA hydrolase